MEAALAPGSGRLPVATGGYPRPGDRGARLRLAVHACDDRHLHAHGPLGSHGIGVGDTSCLAGLSPDAFAQRGLTQLRSNPTGSGGSGAVRGWGTPLTGRFDCLTTTASCPLTVRLMERLSAFSDARQAHNAGGGSSDPFCRGCQDPFVSLTVTSWATDSTGAIVYVSLSDGGLVLPLAIIEVGEEGGDYLVDDVECVTGGAPDPQTSLYVIANTGDTSCPLADAG